MTSPPVEDVYPLTPMQRGMLFHTLYAPGSGVYICQTACLVRGDIDRDAFRKAWQLAVDRHAILRTAFIWKRAEEPQQVVLRRATLPFDELDWSDRTAGEQEASLERFLVEDQANGVDLRKAPLMRITLIRLGEGVHRLIWSHHHLLLDGWSSAQLLKEVFLAYAAQRSGSPIRLDEAPRYGSYVEWLFRQDSKQSEPIWRRLLAGFQSPTALSIDLSQPGAAGPDGDYRHHAFEIGEETVAAMRALAKERRATIATIVQAAWAIVLSRYSGDPEVLFGATVSGRSIPVPDIERMVGVFINTLPVRVALSPDDTPTSLVDRMFRAQSELRDHEWTPLLDIRRWSEIPAGRPLFESIVVFENYPVEQFLREGTAGVTIEDVRSSERINYPLTLVVHPGRVLSMLVAYDARRYGADAIAELARQLAHVVTELVAEPGRPLRRLPGLPADAAVSSLALGRGPALERESASAHQAVFARAEQAPGAIAAQLRGELISYGELQRGAERVAHHLRARGVGRGSIVPIVTERSLPMLQAILGVLAAGAAFALVDPALPAERLDWVIRDTGARVVLRSRSESEGTTPVPSPLVVEDLLDAAAEPGVLPAVRGDDTAYVIYTSGSTGKPRGVLLTHGGLVNSAGLLAERFGLGAGSRVLQLSSVSFDGFVGDVFSALTSGATLCMVEASVALSASAFLRTLDEEHVTAVTLPPSFLAVVAHRPLPSLASIACVGEVCPQELVARWGPGRRFFNGYGPTETTICATIGEPDVHDGRPSIGRPLANVHVHVLDGGMQRVPLGAAGELHIGGSGVALGYLGDAAATASRFVPDPFGGAGARLYRTGDLVRSRTDGSLEFVRRVDDQVKLRGYRIELREVESVLLTFPGVKEVVVVVRGEQLEDRRLVAYVALEPGIGASPDTLASFCARVLPAYMVPASFVLLDALPRNTSGKIDRVALPEPSTSAPEAESAPRAMTPTEAKLAAIWSRVLRRENVDVDADFFAMCGGDSLLAIKMIADVEKAFGRELPVATVFQQPTIAQIAVALGGELVDGTVDLVAEVKLDPEVRGTGARARTDPEDVLLTGATGFLGSFVLGALLDRTRAKVHCVVRAASLPDARRRLDRVLLSHGLRRDESADRIEVVLGDLARPGLGLESGELDRLAERCGAVYHLGAHVNYLHPYARLRAPNVGATEEIARFATRGGPKHLHHVSTLGVFSADYRGRRVDEDEAPDPRNLHLLDRGYAQTKWVAERMIVEAASRGVDAIISRPSDVGGDSRTGVSNPADVLCLTLQACVALRCMPDREVELDIAPVDYVAAAIVELSRVRDRERLVFHLNSPSPLKLSTVRDLLRSMGYVMESVAPKDWASRLEAAARKPGGESFRRLAAMGGGDGSGDDRGWSYDGSHTRAALAASGVTCPPLDEALLGRLLGHLVRSGYLPPPER